ncbi:cytochrome c biogenesis protein CcdA [Streptomyces sp. ISL-112]|uniref:cytochrome c biogenesis CcdA family protein n=1 Tax=unclassified Streptomyces TaxID=2593676 RepID=UPI001BEC8131|nr:MULTISPECIES: cytochrome c biogenesis CcdA family protein [unclassified Streptomyces]MBT2429652.1 cytochrome c biogenesis protein CcdA [Streptomyces sp. ISL-112]MBT2464769.1 cytochrome c biogenesis protein CcdA [Streptomyces sp. ISL-63]
MSDLPLALALTAGILAAVNPCGFALLTAYLSLLVLGDDSPTRGVAIARALAATASITAGFAALFGIFGLAIQPVAGQVQEHLPWFTVTFGILMAAAGAWLLTGRQLPALMPKIRRSPTVTRSVPSMALFGMAYATASLGCTIAPFLAIVVSAFSSGSTIEGIVLFAAYAAGMGLIVGVASLTVALTRSTAVSHLRRAGALAPRLGGGLLLLVGAYVAYYGWYEIRVQRDSTTTDSVIDAAGTVQRVLANVLDTAGPAALAALLTALLLTAYAIHRRNRRCSSRTQARSASASEHTD